MKRLLKTLIVLFLCAGVALCAVGAKDEIASLAAKLTSLTNELQENEVTEIVEEYYVYSPTFDSCYKALSGTRCAEIYKGMYAAAQEMSDGYVRVCGGKRIEDVLNRDKEEIETEVAVAYEAMLNDNPEIFWMPTSYRYITGGSGSKAYLAVSFSHGDGYTVTKAERDKMQAKLEAKVQEIVSGIPKNADDYAKEKYFNDYICDNTEYTVSGAMTNTAYGCLVNGKALCEGYSRAFKLLCNEVGIECDLISGKSQGENHMWNVVNIDGVHSYVDVTWNDSDKELRYMYFNITDEQLSFDHETAQFADVRYYPPFEDVGGLFNIVKRECTYTGNSYYSRNGLTVYYDYADEISKMIKKAAKNGETYVTVMLSADVNREFESNGANYCLSEVQERLADINIKEYFYNRDILVLFFN